MQYIKAAQPGAEVRSEKTRETVAEIIRTVRQSGDAALFSYAAQFDRSTQRALKVERSELDRAYTLTPTSILDDMRICASNIEAFARAQRATLRPLPEVEVAPGVLLGHRIIPVRSCLCYVPGGGYPLFSTALMLAVPAKVAGVERVVACAPVVSGTDSIHPYTLTAMDVAGVDEIYAVGGAQAIAAFSYGTQTIAPVDLIVGPGNQFVTEAKRQCFGQVGVDFLAGPSEVLILADETASPSLVAADILAQSEHDPNARGILLSTSMQLCNDVIAEVERQLKLLPTLVKAGMAWERGGIVAFCDSLDEACALCNDIAPEHLELQLKNSDAVIDRLVNYGSLFIGDNAAEVFGDYASGANHTLPTSGTARYTGGVYVGTFLKTCTHQRMTGAGIRSIGMTAVHMATGEGLFAHANAARLRLRRL